MFICSLGVKIWFHFNLMYTNLVLMQDRERKRDIKCKSQKEIWQLLLKNNLKWTLYWKKMTIKCWERFYVGFFFSLSSKMLTRMLRIQSVGDTEMDQNVCDVLNTIYKSLSCHVTMTTGIHLPPTAWWSEQLILDILMISLSELPIGQKKSLF